MGVSELFRHFSIIVTPSYPTHTHTHTLVIPDIRGGGNRSLGIIFKCSSFFSQCFFPQVGSHVYQVWLTLLHEFHICDRTYTYINFYIYISDTRMERAAFRFQYKLYLHFLILCTAAQTHQY